MSKPKTLLIKLAAVVVRGVTLFFALPFTLIFSFGYVEQIHLLKVYYLIPLLICWFIVIFPFRLFRSLKNLTIYFYLFEFATFGLISSFLLSIELSIFSILSAITFSTILFLNFYFVRMYLWHKRDPGTTINPFLGKDDLKFIVPPIILVILILCYLFVDLTLTPKGRIYVNPFQPFNVPSSSFSIDSEAVGSRYNLETAMYMQNKAPLITVKREIKNTDFIEIYENEKKVFRIDFVDYQVKNVFTYDSSLRPQEHKNGNQSVGFKKPEDKDFKYEVVGSGYFGREKNGVFTNTTQSDSFKDAVKYDLIVSYYLRDKILEVTVTMPTEFPKRSKYVPIFLRKNMKWHLSIKDSEGEVPLVKDIHITY